MDFRIPPKRLRKRYGDTNLAGDFKRDVRVAPSLPADTEALLVRSATEALAMAAKAGQVVSGFAKVEGALQRAIAALIHASDGAADGIRKLDAIAAAKRPENVVNCPKFRPSMF